MDKLNEVLKDFIVDYCGYLPSKIPRLDEVPSTEEFLNKYVAASCPFVVKPKESVFFPTAVEKWQDPNHLMELMQDSPVTVAVTPDGKADSVIGDKFLVPEERILPFNKYMEHFAKPVKGQVYYVQKQNNNLFNEFEALMPEVSKDVPWATKAFGTLPDAANIWIGDSNSFTSMHKDNYENIYFVLTGSKVFTIFPPASMAWMPYQNYPKYQWQFISGSWKMKDLKQQVKWVRQDLKAPTRHKFKMYTSTKGYVVHVSAGEALYLPAMWFHEVTQLSRCISVNYWYDMVYEAKFPYIALLSKLSELADSNKNGMN